jgi:hypothetical protein
MRRAVLLAATMTIVAVLAVGMASADPVNSKNAQIITLDCGGEQVTIATVFQSRAVVLNVVDTTGNFVLTRVEGTETITDPDTGLVLDEFEFDYPIGKGKKEGLQGSLTTCDTTITLEVPEGTLTADLTFTGFFTPRKG